TRDSSLLCLTPPPPPPTPFPYTTLFRSQSRGPGGALGCATPAPDCAKASWPPGAPPAVACASIAVGTANVAAAVAAVAEPKNPQIGRASCRERVEIAVLGEALGKQETVD